MDTISTFLSNLSVAGWLILLAIICILLALSGNRKITILNLTLGPLNIYGRIFSGMVGILSLIVSVFAFIEKPAPTEGVQITGHVLFSTFPSLPNVDYKVRVIPNDVLERVLSTISRADRATTSVNSNSGEFEFSRGDGVREGVHQLTLYENEDRLYNVAMALNDGDHIIFERTAKNDFVVKKQKFVPYLEKRYLTGRWQDELITVNHAAQLIHKNEDVKKYFVDLLKSAEPRRRRMATLVLGRACLSAAEPHLEKILDSQTSIYDRIEAAGYLVCLGSQRSANAEKFLLKTVLNADEFGHKVASSYYLFAVAGDTDDRCILDALILGLEHETIPEGVKREIRRVIGRHLWERFEVDTGGWKLENWKEWWSGASTQFKDCNAVISN